MALDTKDIVLIVISLAVGVLASLLANLSTPSLIGIFHRRKTSRIERNRKRALTDYAELQKLHRGDVDTHLYFNQWASQITHLFAFAIFLLIMAVLLGTTQTALTLQFTAKGQESPYIVRLATAAAQLISIGLGLFSLVFGTTYAQRMGLWRSRLEEFEQYKLALEAQFGELPKEETSKK